MDRQSGKMAEGLRRRATSAAVGLLLLGLGVLGVRWIAASRKAPPPPRKVMQFTAVRIQPQPPPPKPPPPQQQAPPKVVEPERTRVEVKATDIPPPDQPRPASEPAAGPLALAAEGEGPGDAFNLAGNPGGRGLLSGGGLGDGSGGLGDGTGSRFGWYYARIAEEIEEAFRRQRKVAAASARVELRIWADPSGRISRIQLVRSTGNPEVDRAIESVVGLKLRQPPPADIPMPMVARLTARRPG